ncbi:polysaccharide deacetylase family protein [Amycolatopsis magusensis]|uniref:polysaccharide deacetylase family protein n=1 Tax=Amycolatopsis magusensis TaxID=882444 RepID=UPI003C3068C6
MTFQRILTLAAGSVLLAGCAAHQPEPAAPGTPAPPPPAQALAAQAPSPADVRANELGRVPVLMYHRIVASPSSVFDRTPQDFRAELERLAKEDYVPVTTAAFAEGRIDLPAGKHPVVLTFDDGDPTVLTLGQDGEPAPDTAVRILQDVAAAHPGFTPTGSVYVNAEPFGGGEAGTRALRWLHENGFEIGNHTLGHTNLRTASESTAREDVAAGDEAIRTAVPGYRPATLALPFGARPRAAEIARSGEGYEYTGVLLVGAHPAPSPFATEFDASAIPRIRSQGADGEEADYGSAKWLDELAADPDTRFTSDGDPAKISYPDGTGYPAERFAVTAEAY